ncbi:YciI family protein [Shewanella gelidii]|uniref:YCII-related domain-containing protein n=1 Tax=Shewanella gelidii TaxID=1642821 RepID=A0A917N9N7_9GAMM|nr:YciI family protein [Shewanella gelidii]MCL1097604.1 YciI family protein [Shewanella gelidii]GGI80271.1 hypothetical protein GCM10009332_17020 [Shewanella gelidii]
MPQFMISYLGGQQPASSEESQQRYLEYKQWLSSLGDTAVSPANPLKSTTTIHADGSVVNSSATSMSGFTIIEVDSMNAALVVARACPFLQIGGSLEVSELIPMS